MNLDLDRAKNALEKIESLVPGKNSSNGDKEIAKNYLSYCKALPASILQNGLGQAMATQLAGAGGNEMKKNGHGLLYIHLAGWLCRNDELAPYRGQDTKLMQAITEGDQAAYIHAQSEAMAYLNWLKKFAVAYLTQDEEGGR